MKIQHKANRAELRDAALPSLQERLEALEAVLAANPKLLHNAPAAALAVIDKVAAVNSKFPNRRIK